MHSAHFGKDGIHNTKAAVSIHNVVKLFFRSILIVKSDLISEGLFNLVSNNVVCALVLCIPS